MWEEKGASCGEKGTITLAVLTPRSSWVAFWMDSMRRWWQLVRQSLQLLGMNQGIRRDKTGYHGSAICPQNGWLKPDTPAKQSVNLIKPSMSLTTTPGGH